MKSKKLSAKKRMRHSDYQQLAVLIFGDEEAGRNYSEGTPVNEPRRKLIDRFVPIDWLERLLKARARTAAARKRVDQMLRGEPHPRAPIIFKSVEPKWAISEEEVEDISASEAHPNYVLDTYARAAYNEGRIEGQLWVLTIQAHDRWKAKFGQRRGSYPKVAVAEARLADLLKAYFRHHPGHVALTDDAIRKRIEGDWDAQFPHEPEKSSSTLRRHIKAVRDKHPEMRRSTARR